MLAEYLTTAKAILSGTVKLKERGREGENDIGKSGEENTVGDNTLTI